jgi:2-polyprenyl-3-methyl-5-hydroxy-6-metoxy-1,4-benzoquinol methylase
MALAILFPTFDHPAVEERYASWQSEMLARRAAGAGSHTLFYEHDETLADLAADTDAEYLLAITDPLILIAPSTVEALRAAIADGRVAIPVSNEPGREEQRASLPEPYMTIRQFEEMADRLARRGDTTLPVAWGEEDPGAFLCTRAFAIQNRRTIRDALRGEQAVIARSAYAHRWAALRAQERLDLLERIPRDAHSILEFGCAEGLLGRAVKERQKARIVGIELDQQAAAKARKRLDDVYCGDVRELINIMTERFDFIVGGDILEHLDDPWSFLVDLRQVSAPGGRLLLSIPNAANWSIVADLLRGRFDYTYIGITCAGHLRFFTRQTIADALSIAGWEVVTIDPQPTIETREFEAMLANLRAAGITHSAEELAAPGYYVVARNPVRR